MKNKIKKLLQEHHDIMSQYINAGDELSRTPYDLKAKNILVDLLNEHNKTSFKNLFIDTDETFYYEEVDMILDQDNDFGFKNLLLYNAYEAYH